MIYIFEDRSDDILSKLYQCAYTDAAISSFIYSEGNGNLLDIATTQLSKHPTEDVMVFIDITPDNRNTIWIYNQLQKKYRVSGRRLLTIPIVNSEYYFIRSIAGSHLIHDLTGLDECLHVKPWRNSPLVAGELERKMCKNFEKFCKLYLIKCVALCSAHSRMSNNSNTMYGVYYEKDCPCTHPEVTCGTKSLLSKACQYVSKYPCFPLNHIMGRRIRNLSKRDIIGLNQQLCDLLNRKIEEFATANGRLASEKLIPLE